MSSEKEEESKNDEQYENTEDRIPSFGNGDNFKMYYALGPEVDQPSIVETISKEDILDCEARSESDSSPRNSTIPPDVVTSAKKIRIITEEPRRVNINNVSFDDRDKPGTLEDTRDYTSMQRQMDAYQNLEDLLDVPWEESDLAPPNKVDVVLRVGGELGQRYNNV